MSMVIARASKASSNLQGHFVDHLAVLALTKLLGNGKF